MFVTTFYSYKGGVGRTLSLVNVASELALRGKSVLVVDFDLEAPGLSSFEFNGLAPPSGECNGMVDFIRSWLEQSRSPDVRDYVYEHRSINDGVGPIWVMPAGHINASYGAKFREIDFNELYTDHDGYLLFEDLKAQWRDVLGVDYVLVDSRTGHTDVGGICLRQIPDMIAFIFWPNIQNLEGLSAVVSEINQDGDERGRKIERIFVPSNIPTLDDEDEILSGLLSRFRKRLAYVREQEVTLRHYPSLDLLQQQIFAVSHPKSRLAAEYRFLTDKIMARNLQDEGGVALYLEDLVRRSRRISGMAINESLTIPRTEMSVVDGLLRRDWTNPSVNRTLASVKARDGDFKGALQLLHKVLKSPKPSLNDYLLSLEWSEILGQYDDDITAIDHLLNDEDSGPRHVIAALKSLSKVPTGQSFQLTEQAGIRRLTPGQLARIAQALQSDRKEVRLVTMIIQAAIQRPDVQIQDYTESSLVISLSLALIGGGAYEDAQFLLERTELGKARNDLRVQFNLAMARWGKSGSADVEDFSTVANIWESLSEEESGINANVYQCLAVVYSVIGQSDMAITYLNRARDEMIKEFEQFSCWNYLKVDDVRFEEDLAEIEKTIKATTKLLPRLFVENLQISVH